MSDAWLDEATEERILWLRGKLHPYDRIGQPPLGGGGTRSSDLDLTDILDQRDRDYCIATLRSRWSSSGADVCGAGGR